MNNIYSGILAGLFFTLISSLFFWKSWKKRGYIWPTSKEEKEKESDIKQGAIPIVIVGGFILSRLDFNSDLVYAALASWIFSMVILFKALDPVIRKKHRR